MRSGIFRRWRSAARGDRHVTVSEWRDEGLLSLRLNLADGAQPRIDGLQFVECAEGRRAEGVARLVRQGWYRGGRHLLMLGFRQRQMTILPRPPVPDAELLDATRWQLQGTLDYPPEEAVLDLLRLGQDEAPARQQVAVFSVRRSVLAPWIAPLADQRVTLEAVEVADCAQRNLAALHAPADRSIAMLSLREDSIVFTVTRGSELLVSRSFDAASLTKPAQAGRAEPPAAEVDALAERVGLHLQRLLDTLERRATALAPAQVLVLEHPRHAALLAQCAELTGLRVIGLNLDGLWADAPAASPNGPAPSEFLHLLGAALRPAPEAVA